MFDAAEVGHTLDKDTYSERLPRLRTELLELQYQLRETRTPVIVILAGNDRPGANESLNLLHEWLDARYLEVHAYGKATDEEREHPLFWRYWRALPRGGTIGFYLRAWTVKTVLDRLRGDLSPEALEHRIAIINRFEKSLVEDGALIMKFWLHLPRKEMIQRLKSVRKNPQKSWKIHPEDREIYKKYKKGQRLIEDVIQRTSTVEAPWNIIESHDSRYRNFTIGQRIVLKLRERLKAVPNKPVVNAFLKENRPQKNRLDAVNLKLALSKPDYEKELAILHERLAHLSHRAQNLKAGTVLVFEGWDAAGKGGIIRRLTRAMDASHYRVIPVAAPTQEEHAYHYLWRFWNRLPRRGDMAIFDRSWYGRVLVERIEGFADSAAWERAYDEINDFEQQLTDDGYLVMKFWVEIDAQEQLRRFEKRKEVPYKKYKMTDEDYRNRAKWEDYKTAAHLMIERTHTPMAPWHIIPNNDKRYGRVKAIQLLCDALEKNLAQR